MHQTGKQKCKTINNDGRSNDDGLIKDKATFQNYIKVCCFIFKSINK